MRIVTLLVVLLLLLGSCSNEAVPVSNDNGGAAFVIGQLGLIAASPLSINRESIVNAAGGILISESCDFSPKGIITAIENLIARGCDGIIYTPMSESTLPQITRLCEEAQVYWVISMRTISDPEIRQFVEGSPYYVGNVSENDEDAGYEIVRILAQSGVKEIALISISRLDAAVDARERGLYKAAEEYGIRVVAEVRNCKSVDDVSRAVNGFIEVYPDLDAVFRVAALVRGNAESAVMDSILSSGRHDHIRFASIDFNQDTEKYFNQNCIAVVAGGHIPLDASIAAAMLVNAVTGYPINDNGPLTFTIDYLMLSSREEFETYYAIVGDDRSPLFSEEIIRSMLLKEHNPQLIAEEYQRIIDNYTIENLHKIFE